MLQLPNPMLSLIFILFNFSVPHDQYKATIVCMKRALLFSPCYLFLSPFLSFAHSLNAFPPRFCPHLYSSVTSPKVA